jgi:hypothetical protein
MVAKDKNRKAPATPATKPKFPYTTKPGSLRKLLKLIPQRPKPTKVDMNLLRSWGFNDSNDYSVLRVLKAVGLLNEGNQPSELYSHFMKISEGARFLGPEIKRVYAPMFQASHTPYNETNEKLRNLFNIHSGGGESVIDLQIHTFKALCEHASFGEGDALASPEAPAMSSQLAPGQQHSDGVGPSPTIHINLHIHLPENKTRREYEDMIEDIGRHIFGRYKGSVSDA